MLNHQSVLAELSSVLDPIPTESVDKACRMIADAKNVLLYGCGREKLQLCGLAMRLYHLGVDASMVADMAAPPLGKGDLFISSAGPGELSTVTALTEVAKRDGAEVLFFTANPESPTIAMADHVVIIPAQTMASDRDSNKTSALPMGSIYEGSMFVLFELMILRTQALMRVSTDEMRTRHTNME